MPWSVADDGFFFRRSREPRWLWIVLVRCVLGLALARHLVLGLALVGALALARRLVPRLVLVEDLARRDSKS